MSDTDAIIRIVENAAAYMPEDHYYALALLLDPDGAVNAAMGERARQEPVDAALFERVMARVRRQLEEKR